MRYDVVRGNFKRVDRCLRPGSHTPTEDVQVSPARIVGFLVAAVACFAIAYAVSHGSGDSDAAAAPVVAPHAACPPRPWRSPPARPRCPRWRRRAAPSARRQGGQAGAAPRAPAPSTTPGAERAVRRRAAAAAAAVAAAVAAASSKAERETEMDLLLEIVEGPGAGRQIELRGTGRPRARRVGRRGARGRPDLAPPRARDAVGARGIVVEDLESTNGTFVNHDEVHSPVELAPGDELLVGVTVMQLRSPEQVRAQASAVRAVPPGLATPERRPAYVDAGPGAGRARGPGRRHPRARPARRLAREVQGGAGAAGPLRARRALVVIYLGLVR